MELEDKIRIIYEDETSYWFNSKKTLAEPTLNDLPLKITARHPLSGEFVKVNFGDNAIGIGSSGQIEYVGLEKLDASRYEVKYHTWELSFVQITDKKTGFEIFLGGPRRG